MPSSNASTLDQQAAVLRELRRADEMRKTSLDTLRRSADEALEQTQLTSVQATNTKSSRDAERLAALDRTRKSLLDNNLKRAWESLSPDALAASTVSYNAPSDQLAEEISATTAAAAAAIRDLNTSELKQKSARWAKISAIMFALLLAILGIWLTVATLRAENAFRAAEGAIAAGDLDKYATQFALLGTALPGYRSTEAAALNAQWNALSTRQSLPPTKNPNMMITSTTAAVALQSPSTSTNTPLPNPTPTPTATPTPVSTLTPTASPTPTPTVVRIPTLGPTCQTGRAEITQPKDGDVVRGTIAVMGTAACIGFAYYKFEFVDARCGATGLCFVAGKFTKAVESGRLMNWDTTRTWDNGSMPNGVWRLRLTVVGGERPPSIPSYLPQFGEVTIRIEN